jgi:hypothetical protein
MNCDDARRLIGIDDGPEVERHLSTCKSCGEFSNELKRGIELLTGAEDVEPPADAWDKLAPKLSPRRLWSPGLAASFLVGAILVFVLRSGPHKNFEITIRERADAFKPQEVDSLITDYASSGGAILFVPTPSDEEGGK